MAIQIPISSSVQPVNPSLIFSDGFELENSSLIPSENYSGSFTQGLNSVEFYVYDANSQLQYSDYNFTEYSIVENSDPGASPYGANLSTNTSSLSPTNVLSINPETDVYNAGFNVGKLYGVYNFVNHELSSSNDSRYYLAEISGDRTEIRIKSNFLSDTDMKTSYINFENTINAVDFFDEFYITFGGNEYHIGVNSQYVEGPDNVENDSSILIKLFDALPPKYKEFDELYVVTKTAETQVYEIEFEEDLSVIDNNIQLRGPNTNLEIKDFINNSTVYQNKDELYGTESSGSKDQLINRLDQRGITLTPNYSTASFDQFVNFSSAKQRTLNFYEKVSRIQAYEADIAVLTVTTGSNPTTEVSNSIAGLYTKIEEEIKAFDGWDYYLYYNTASDSYPKDTSIGQKYPYPLLDTGSTTVLNWLGSDVENSQYYGGVLLSASLYDNSNENWLYYTIPTFITEQNNNENYVEFCNMVGQSFDELWLYTKTITQKLRTTNVIDEGVPLSLADDVITSLGYTGYGNNYNNQDNFIGLIGNDDGVFVPPTGSELITDYIAINKGEIINYWQTEYSWEDYVEQLITQGWPYPIDHVSKEIFKRLYHNMSYLVKKKGTISGLRQLINIWGIPNTILRINEFGGKNKDQTDDYDLWYNRYSYAFKPVANAYRASASAIIPWQPLYRNKIADAANIVPDGVGFRFKTTGYPSSSYAGSFNTQSLAVKKSNNQNDDKFDWGIILNYTGSTSGSYRGAGNSDYRNWAEMKFYMSGAAADGGNVISDPIFLPFFDGGWWSVLFQRDQHVDYTNNSNRVTYTLYAKNKIYDGNDGNSIGFEGSASVDAFDVTAGGVYGTGIYGTAIYGAQISGSINNAWNTHSFAGEKNGVYLGGKIEGAQVGGLICNEPGQAFSGSFQEFRYYSNPLSESVFNDFVMNPESIEGNKITGSESSFDIIGFRAPFGNELENFFTSSNEVTSSTYNEYLTSSHPAITASAASLETGSFFNRNNGEVSSSYYIRYFEDTVRRTFSETNVETYFLDQPSIGFRNRISNKIQVQEDLNFGNILSGLVSIEKDPFISQSYTENLNQLEVAFSPQDEVNDDIIQSLGYGAIQEVIADPRFRSSSDDFYPGLRDIAKDYFKKYTKSNVFDYMRLIKYFDDSLFKAIKNYVPARTSVSTGIVIHQNMLERNRYREPQVDMVTTQSYAITNIPLTTKNLELTGSIDLYDFSGSAGGSVNKYNVSSSQFGYYTLETTAATTVPAGSYRIINSVTSTVSSPNQNPTEMYGDLYAEKLNDLFGLLPSVDPPQSGFLRSTKPVKSAFSLQVNSNAITDIQLIISSSIRGEIYKSDSFTPNNTLRTRRTPLLDIMPEEALAYVIHNIGNNIGAINVSYAGMKTLDLLDPNEGQGSDNNDISSSGDYSDQGYIENVSIGGWAGYTGSFSSGIVSKVITDQEAFYNGEFSGSITDARERDVQYNPYKKVPADITVPWILPSNDFTDAGVTQVNNRLKNIIIWDPFTTGTALVTAGAIQNTVSTGTYTNVNIQIASGAGSGTIKATVLVATSFGNPVLGEITITNNLATGIVAGDDFIIPAGELTGQTNDITLNNIQQAALTSFSNITSTGFDCDNLDNPFFIFLAGSPFNLINQKTYNISFDITNDASTGNAGIGLSQVASIGNQQMLFSDININAKGNGPFTASFTTAFVPNGAETLKARVSAQPGFKGTISNFNIAPNYAADPSWNEVVADIYLNPLQQDQWQIENTQSLLFENSDYNPLNNNVNINRSSSTRLLLSYNDEQYQPENFDAVVTYSLDNTSQSVFADIPDSNYTKFSSINPRYNGSELQSLDYNNFTPSGTIGEPLNLPVQRFNRKLKTKILSSSVATEFIDGTTQSAFIPDPRTPNGSVGVRAWAGDNSYGKTAVISKFPRYIAHFQDSFEQFNNWDTQQYNIDSLIEIPSESIANRQGFQPNTIIIDGSNESKKIVSSTFEPRRKVAVSYDSLKTGKLDFSNQKSKKGFGKLYKLGGGAIQYLTINSNEVARTRAAISFSYDYKGGITGSNQTSDTIQLITSSTDVKVNTDLIPGTGYSVSGFSPNTTTTNGSGTGLTVDILEVDELGAIVRFNISSNGNGYFPGDIINVVGGDNNASFITNIKTEKGFLLSGSITDLLYTKQEGRKKRVAAGVDDESVLRVRGPQLANYHTYNLATAEQSFLGSPVCYVAPFDQVFVSGSNNNNPPFWVNQGNLPDDPESYYKWNPSGSRMNSYEDTQTPYLIQRGDVLRIEGFREFTKSGAKQFSNFKEDFVIMDVINYHYSSSLQLQSLNVGNNAVGAVGETGQLYTVATAGTAISSQGITATIQGTVDVALGTGGAQARFVSDGFTIVEAYTFVSGSTGTSTGTPANYAVGDTYPINLAAIGAGTVNVVINIKNMKNKVEVQGNPPQSVLVSDTGSDNPWGFEAYQECGIPGAPKVTSITDTGSFAVKWPTFLVTDRDPSSVLNGIEEGEIGRFTIRRQVENDSSVMLVDIEPAAKQPSIFSGSLSNGQFNQVLYPPSFISGQTQLVAGNPNIDTNTLFIGNNPVGPYSGTAPTSTSTIMLKYSNSSGRGKGGQIQFTFLDGNITAFKLFTFSNVTQSNLLTGPPPKGYQVGDIITVTADEVKDAVNTATSSTIINLASGEFKFVLTAEDLGTNVVRKTVGAAAPSGQGFLIPNDLSAIQKENALTIINELRSKNAFPIKDISNAQNSITKTFDGLDVDDPEGFVQ